MGNEDSKPAKPKEEKEAVDTNGKLADVGLKFGRVGADHSKQDSAPKTLKERSKDAINNMSFDWSRNDVEPLWIYENVEAAKWSVQQVAEFIRTLTGCSEYADAFIGQEIDGQALMLLREEHMVVAMNMKLGPALKIISKVTQLKRASMKDP